MSNSRLVRGHFFNHLEVLELDIVARYLLIGLLCEADDYGKFNNNPAMLRAHIFPTDKISESKIRGYIDTLEKKGIICCYKVANREFAHFPYWLSTGWFLKQRMDHPREEVIPLCPGHGGPSKEVNYLE